jgi:SAM-dependent methyltransferase
LHAGRVTHYIKCNLCGQDNTEVFFDSGDVRIVRCKTCGLIYNNPQFQAEEEIYCADYYKDYYAVNEPLAEKPADYIQGHDYKKDGEIISQLKKKKPEGRVLEVGCCFGLFLKSAAQAGYETKGVDVSRYAASYARDVLGIDVFIGELRQAAFPDNHFDIIYMSHLLEHLKDPLVELQEARRILKQDGILLIEAPNEYRSLSGVIRGMRFKERKPILFPPLHLYYFSARTLRSMLQKAGFRTINRRITYSSVPDIAASAQDILGSQAGAFLKRHSRMERMASFLIKKFITAFDLGIIIRIYAVKDGGKG